MNDDMFVDENANPYGNPQDHVYSNKQENGEGDQQGNPYSAPNEPQYSPAGKKIGLGFGIASLVLGIVSLLCFCTCINIILAILAIIFGIIQIVSYENKGMAIGGIVTATISIILFVTCYGLLLSNASFMRMVEDEMGNGFDQRDIYEFMEEYNYDMEDML
ncbi:MAG: DUF4190 domain-containing protein [Lachnospiraceae bacterium]|nr:DUF4190 domain-containing protein [Lachnospiraceae bacterium]